MNWPEAFTKDGKQVHVIIETPLGSRNKFSYDLETGLFKLKKILPAAALFPCHMGFIPNTMGEDGDPLDALVLMDESSYPGCLVECRLIGGIQATQKEKGGKAIRNDRYILVPTKGKESDHIKTLNDLNKNWINGLTDFFKLYNAFYDVEFNSLGLVNVTTSLKDIKRQLL